MKNRTGGWAASGFWNVIWAMTAAAGSPYFLYKLLRTDAYRKGISEKLGHVARREGDRRCIWLHAVSVGEFNAARTLIAAIRSELPECDLVLSLTTPSAHALALQRCPDIPVIWFPFDATRFIRRSLDRVRPSLVVIMETELWPNFLLEAERRAVPVLIVNGRISHKSYLYYRAAWPMLTRAFHHPEKYAVQTERYRERLLALGVPDKKVVVTGNMKYDAIELDADQADAPRTGEQLGLSRDETVFTAGCTHPGEEEIALSVYEGLREDFRGLRLVLVPRHIDRADAIERMVRSRGHDVARRTGGTVSGDGRPVILIDTFGELSAVYGISDIVFVGKSLCGRGGQNMLEPAGLGKAVLFGPHVANFQEGADELVSEGAALCVADAEQLALQVRKLLENPSAAAKMGRAAQEVIARNRGATARHTDMIKQVLKDSSSRKE